MWRKIAESETWRWIKRYCFSVEFLAFVIVVGMCIYFYWKYDKNKIRVNIEEIDYTPLFEMRADPRLQRNNRQPQQYIWASSSSPPKKKKRVFKHEEKCREIFEKLFRRDFPSVRPAFLKNPTTGHNLELDGYCQSLKLAFEYDGKQHAKYDEHFHGKNKDAFVYQVVKDDYKTKKCKLEGIDLVRIPHYIHFDSLEEYIVRELKRINRM